MIESIIPVLKSRQAVISVQAHSIHKHLWFHIFYDFDKLDEELENVWACGQHALRVRQTIANSILFTST